MIQGTIAEEIKKIDAEMQMAEEEAKKTEEARAESERIAVESEKNRIAEEQAALAEKNKTQGGEQAGVENGDDIDKETYKEILDRRAKEESELLEKKRKEEAMSNPIVQKTIDAVLSGQDPSKVLSVLNAPSPESLDEKTLFFASLDENTSDEDAESAYESFKTLPEKTQKVLIESQRKEYEIEYNKTIEKLKSNPIEAKKAQLIAAYDSLDESISKMVGTEVSGVRISNKIAADIFTSAQELVGIYRKSDGSPDVEKAITNASKLAISGYVESKAKKEAADATKREIFKEFHNPQGQPHIPNADQKQLTQAEADEKAVEAKAAPFKIN